MDRDSPFELLRIKRSSGEATTHSRNKARCERSDRESQRQADVHDSDLADAPALTRRCGRGYASPMRMPQKARVACACDAHHQWASLFFFFTCQRARARA